MNEPVELARLLALMRSPGEPVGVRLKALDNLEAFMRAAHREMSAHQLKAYRAILREIRGVRKMIEAEEDEGQGDE